jgi:pentatricopeptide repeat protein
MYTLYGEYRIPERTLDYLDGYQHSRPVRVGNAAARQFQLDIYGEVADALVQYVRSGGRFDRDAQRMVRGIADVIVQRWQEPDFGIWEFRSGKRHNTHSKIMAWVGLQRCLELASDYRRLRPILDYAHVRDQIFDWIIQHGFDQRLGHFIASPMRDLDAALLVIPLVGFLPGHDPRVAATVRAIRKTLTVDDLVYRYRSPDGLPGGEGAFLICSFWLVEALARMGNTDEALELFERLLERCNDVGLLAEQIEPSTGAQLGNFPQALSHIGLMNAALTLEEVARGAPRVSLRA